MRPPAEPRPEPLLAIARALVYGRPLRQAVPDAALDWDTVAAEAEHERLAPTLYMALRGSAAPSPIVARLRAAWMAAERQSLLAGAQLGEILTAFARAGVAAILLKGPALANEHYPDPALRPFTDLDVLVRRGDRDRAIETLSALGYVHASPGRSLAYELEHAPAAYFCTPGDASRLPVDLHWRLVAHPGGGRGAELAADEIWSRARPTGRDAALALAPEDLLIYLAAHLAIHHSLAGALWQVDLALVLRRHHGALDWDAVAARARRWGAAGAVYYALRVVGERFGVPSPTHALNRLRPDAVRVTMVHALLAGGPERLVRLEYLVGLLMLDRASDIIRTLRAGLIPAPRWLRSRYESDSLLAAYVAHYGRVARTVARAVI